MLINRKLLLKRLTSRFSKPQKAYVVTAPFFVPFAKIVQFIDGAGAWFARVAQHQHEPSHDTIVPGDLLSILGKSTRVEFISSPKSLVRLNGGVLEVHGVRSKFEPQLRKYLKNLAMAKFTEYSQVYATAFGVKFHRLTVKEMRTRFGSCSARGNLNYCWRVVFAPESVLAYLCAHEVAHLQEMNHSKQFWALVERLCPDYKTQQNWLKRHGKQLYHFPK